MGRDKDIVYGVYDKTRGGWRMWRLLRILQKRNTTQKQELKIQYEYIKRKRPDDKITMKDDRVMITKGEKEEILIIIHPILLRWQNKKFM